MRIYSIDFQQFLKLTRQYDSTEADRFVCYWDTPQAYYLEYPVVSNAGASMGYVLRSKIRKRDVFEFVRSQVPSEPLDEKLALCYFEAQYLSHYKRVIRALK